VSLRLAEKYIEAFAQLAKKGTSILLPTNTGDISSMVSQAATIFQQLQQKAFISSRSSTPYSPSPSPSSSSSPSPSPSPSPSSSSSSSPLLSPSPSPPSLSPSPSHFSSENDEKNLSKNQVTKKEKEKKVKEKKEKEKKEKEKKKKRKKKKKNQKKKKKKKNENYLKHSGETSIPAIDFPGSLANIIILWKTFIGIQSKIFV